MVFEKDARITELLCLLPTPTARTPCPQVLGKLRTAVIQVATWHAKSNRDSNSFWFEGSWRRSSVHHLTTFAFQREVRFARGFPENRRKPD